MEEIIVCIIALIVVGIAAYKSNKIISDCTETVNDSTFRIAVLETQLSRYDWNYGIISQDDRKIVLVKYEDGTVSIAKTFCGKFIDQYLKREDQPIAYNEYVTRDIKNCI
jgi:hypothetical protein